MSDDVFNALNTEKDDKGYKTIATLLRAKLETEVRDEKLFSEFRNDILHYNKDMARIGSNLNQIAHKLHLFKPVEAEELMPQVVTLNKIMVHINLSLSEALVNIENLKN